MEKHYIIIVGRRNNGKSSIINATTGQQTAIVSDVAGTTTDPVKKSYEIPGYASIVFIDTAGTDDSGELGLLRTQKTKEAITHADIAILVIAGNIFGEPEKQLVSQFKASNIPFIIVHNKSDIEPLAENLRNELSHEYQVPVIDFSAQNKNDIPLLISALQTIKLPESRSLLKKLIEPGEIILLVTPIDSEAPNGRLILPQVKTIRDILDNHCISIVLQPDEIKGFLNTGIVPALVITDSQAFKTVASLIPNNIPLTGFSIVMAHNKGNFDKYVEGTEYIDKLKDNDRILILESCSHHTSCEDIGRVKIPALLSKSGKKLTFDFIAGLDPIQRPLTDYALVIQCGGCMVTHQQLQNRLTPFIEAGIPVSNYGMTIAWLQGIFQRSVAPFLNPRI